MLIQLHIKNFVLVESLAIDWQNGMTAITGETGAGKSIMLDALNLTLGGRAQNHMIRNGSDKSEVIAIFNTDSKPQAKAFLKVLDIDDTECILRRVIQRDGASKAWINGIPVTLKQLSQLAEYLIDIHSQHEHQSLLFGHMQRQLLDDYGNYPHVLQQVADSWQQWQETCQQLSAMTDSAGSFEDRIELLSYQVEELEQFGLSEGDYQPLCEQQQLLASGAELKQLCYQLQQLLQGDDINNIESSLHQGQRLLEQQAQLPSSLQQAQEMFEQMGIISGELVGTLRHADDEVDIDPEQLAIVEERLGTYHDLARKHRVEPEQLFDCFQQLNRELESMKGATANRQQLQQLAQQQAKQYSSYAKQLTASRNKSAKQLTLQVNQYFEMLSMQGVELQIAIEPKALDQGNEKGIDNIEFLVRTNAGQSFCGLKKIVSGGELSRISLAINVVTAQTSNVATMIFDEVDSGIGGGTAEVVGKLLKRLGDHAQVICITHLAQVAANAHHQLRVSKSTTDNQTAMTMTVLDTDSRIEELARMSAGEVISDEARELAKVMLNSE